MAQSTMVFLLFLTTFAAAIHQEEPRQLKEKNSIATANKFFSLNFYKLLRSKPGNLIMSPFSAMAALAMVLQGAGGETAQQLQSALQLPADPAFVRRGFKEFLDGLQTNEQVIVRIANKVFTRRGAHIKAPFRNTVVDSFRSDAEELDFQNKTEESRVSINRWVENVTDNKIRNCLDDLDQDTLMVLVNAIYLKANWATAFQKENTRNKIFHTTTNSQVTVPMMHLTSQFSYMALPDLGARILELPYQGLSMRMYLIVPNTVSGLPRVEEGLSRLNLHIIKHAMNYGLVDVALPKFKIESKFYLHEDLPKIGIRDLFSERANLTGITDHKVLVSKAIQKAFVEVTEKGTTAAAATAVQTEYASAPDFIPSPEIFNVDHPFLFLLVASEDFILFMGKIEQPVF